MILNNKNLNRKKSSILKRDSVIFSVMQKVSTQILEIKIKRHLTVEMALSDITMMEKQNHNKIQNTNMKSLNHKTILKLKKSKNQFLKLLKPKIIRTIK